MAFHAPTMGEHIMRYLYALWFIKRRSVLDVGCYTGYGMSLLSFGAKKVTGYDLDEHALLVAQKNYKYQCPTEFKKLDFNKDEFPTDEKFEVATCFEVLEHVEDPENLLIKIKNTLTPDGLLVFSVPHMVKNRQHITLFDESKIKEMVSKHFDIKQFHIFDQNPITKTPCWAGVVDYVGMAQMKKL